MPILALGGLMLLVGAVRQSAELGTVGLTLTLWSAFYVAMTETW